MRDIFDVLAIIKKEFLECVGDGEEFDNAREHALDQLTIEECEEYSEATAQAFTALEKRFKAIQAKYRTV